MLQAELVCDKKEYHANADMIYMVGVLMGSLFSGLLSDRFVSPSHLSSLCLSPFRLSLSPFYHACLPVSGIGSLPPAFIASERLSNGFHTLREIVKKLSYPLRDCLRVFIPFERLAKSFHTL